jgi:putative FmdB family regulatory protein
VPTYDYHCKSCNTTYEARESFSAPMEHACQECETGIAKRLLTAPLIVFKGSGWYATDSRNKSTANVDGGSTDSASDSGGTGSKSEAKSDSKKSDSKKSDSAKSESKAAKADGSSSTKSEAAAAN